MNNLPPGVTPDDIDGLYPEPEDVNADDSEILDYLVQFHEPELIEVIRESEYLMDLARRHFNV